LARAVSARLHKISAPRSGQEYDDVLKRSVRRMESRRAALVRERTEALALFNRLLAELPERRDLLLRNHPRFQTWSLTELILEKSAAEALNRSRPSEGFARLALLAADHLDPGFYGKEQIEDLKARSWAQIGNALRIRSDLGSAEAAFETSFEHLRKGTGDPLEQAACLNLKTSLLLARRQLAEAEAAQRRAVSIFLKAGEQHLAGRALLLLGTILAVGGKPQEGAQFQLRGSTLLDPGREPHLLFFAWHNFVDNLSRAGRFKEARELLSTLRPLYAKFSSPAVQSRQQWVAGRIALQYGERADARTLFKGARKGFLQDERLQEAAFMEEALKKTRQRSGMID
jgi:tetratricopeptide (TPR) repeat protein